MWTDPDSSFPKWAPYSLKPGQLRIAEEPHYTPGGVENNSTDSQTLSEKSHNTRRWEHKNSKCSPPVALRTGMADEGRGTPGWAAWRPICSPTHAGPSSCALGVHHPTPSVPLIVITMHPKRGRFLCQESDFFFFLDEPKHSTLPGEIWRQFAC